MKVLVRLSKLGRCQLSTTHFLCLNDCPGTFDFRAILLYQILNSRKRNFLLMFHGLLEGAMIHFSVSRHSPHRHSRKPAESGETVNNFQYACFHFGAPIPIELPSLRVVRDFHDRCEGDIRRLLRSSMHILSYRSKTPKSRITEIPRLTV